MKYNLSFFLWTEGKKLSMNADVTALNDEVAVLVAKQIIDLHMAVGPIKLVRCSDKQEIDIPQ